MRQTDSDSQAQYKRQWSYEEAFCRNLGLVSEQEQERLRKSRVAIGGMGGVGGVHAVTLARLGVGQFTIADPDTFVVANTNRQYGARLSNLDRSKARVMEEVLRDINPEAQIRVTEGPIDETNAGEFLKDADLFVDGLDFYEIDVRRLMFNLAHRKGIPAMTFGPLGLGTAWLVFQPDGMSFDEYYDFSDDMSPIEKIAAFAVGLGPKMMHLSYMDLSRVDINTRTAPSSGAACQLAAGVMGVEAVKVLLNRGTVRAAPYYHQFDPFTYRFVSRRLWGGNRHPLQRFKRWWIVRRYQSLKAKQAAAE